MKTQRKKYWGLLVLCLIVTASYAASSHSANEKRFTTSVVDDDILLSDNSSGLIWTNSVYGFKPISGKNRVKANEVATKYCEELSFGGYKDWRLGMVEEVQTLETKTDEHGISLYYRNPKCKRALAHKSDNTLAFVATSNNQPVGGIVGRKFPSGTRCVREK